MMNSVGSQVVEEQTEFTRGCMNLKQHHSHVPVRKAPLAELDAAGRPRLETDAS